MITKKKEEEKEKIMIMMMIMMMMMMMMVVVVVMITDEDDAVDGIAKATSKLFGILVMLSPIENHALTLMHTLHP